MKAREAAYLSLMRCESGGKYSNLEVSSAIKKYSLEGSERALFTSLVYGVIEKKISIDWYLSRLSSRPLCKLESSVAVILRIGMYQILYLDRIPDSAACNECVELAKRYTHKGTSGFVNAVLRAAVRQKHALPMPKEGTEEYLSVKYSCPMWLCRMWRRQYGEEKCLEILAGVNRVPDMTLRVNTLKISRGELIFGLRERGIPAFETELSPFGVKITSPLSISELPELDTGLAFVQDEASQLCVLTLDAKSGETVIDACSCPGGKSFSIAVCMENKGKVMSFDLHESKLSLVASGAKRLGIDIISVEAADSSKLKPELIETADRVLCDVPCSGLGVIAKKPDLRHKEETELERLPEIQYKILKNCSRYVKRGGVLVYSTCTVNKAENEEITARFIEENPEFAPDGDKTVLGAAQRVIFPSENGSDGFFIAKFRRK